MKLLFDTHAFIWWDGDQSKLSAEALAACQSTENSLHLSLASVWELQIKMQLGKQLPNNVFDEKKNLVQSTNIASFGVFEYCFDAFESYITDVHTVLSKYGYFEKSADLSVIDKFFGVAFKDMADWPSEKPDSNETENKP